MDISGMATAKRTAPAWGGYKKPDFDRSSGASSDAGFFGVTVPDHLSGEAGESTAPAFDIHAVMQDASEAGSPAERDEEEFEELGEGAFRQIGRSFLGILGTGASISAVAALAIWAMPGPETDALSVAEADVEMISAPSNSEVDNENPAVAGDPVQIALKEVPVPVPAISLTQVELKPAASVEINVELPIPVVVAAEDGAKPGEGASFYAVKYPGPVPIVREYAMAAMMAAESGVIAQGSDEEWAEKDVLVQPAEAQVKKREWVSVMIPKPRPVF